MTEPLRSVGRRLRMRDDPEERSVGRPTRILVSVLVLLPVIFNAVMLWPEVFPGAPSLNDNSFQSMLVRVASETLASGRNPLDFWEPQLELGFPQFLYYQNLPHLFVVGLDRLLLGAADDFTLFNLVRFGLLIGLPLTVFWSMRRMGFSLVAAAVSAAASSLLAGDARYGFEYDSYIWRGLGMFTQLWAMHLSFITLACVYRVLKTGKGYVLAVLAFALLALSHLIYAYMMVITLGLVLVIMGDLRTILPRAGRLAIVGVGALALSSYMWLPFVTSPQYLGASPYLQDWKYDSFGAETILGWLVSGDLMDHGRIAVLTFLLGAGIVFALLRRSRLTILALTGFLVWLVLYFGRPTLGPIADLFPLHDSLLFHRFIGEMELFAIILMGIGGAGIWSLVEGWVSRVKEISVSRRAWLAPLAGFVVILIILAPAVNERAQYYGDNAAWINRAHNALVADKDLQAVMAAIKAQPYGGRSYAGLRTNYGKDMGVGPDLKVTDILTFDDIPAVSPPYQSLSLNADFIWWFQDQDPSDFDLMDVRYAIAPSTLKVPDFYTPMLKTRRYTLYRIPTSGMAEYVGIASRRAATSQRNLFDANLKWFQGSDPAAHRFIRWDFLQPLGAPAPRQPCPTGRTLAEQDEPDSIQVTVDCPTDSALALKVTYHPNWHVTVDGKEVPTYMVSPSYVGIDLPAGRHVVSAVYEATPSKIPLLLFGLVVFGGFVVLRRRIDALPRRLPVRASSPRVEGPTTGAKSLTLPGAIAKPLSRASAPSMSARLGWATSRDLGRWALPVLLVVGVLLPIVIGAVSGTLDIPRNDDWVYRNDATALFETGRLAVNSVSEAIFVGQLLVAQPFLLLSGGATWGLVLAGIAFETIVILAGYFAFSRILPRPLAALAIGLLIVFPGYLPFAVSFMTDVPAIAAELVCLALGMVALSQRPVRWRWIVAALAVGLLGFSVRQFALAAPLAVLTAVILAEPRRWRPWASAIVVVALAVALYEWRTSLSGGLSDLQTGDNGSWRLLLVASTLSLVLLPAAVVGWARWRDRIHRVDTLVGMGVGVLLIAGRLGDLATTGRLPQVLLDVNITQFGAPAEIYLTGGRPVLFPDPLWTVVSALALVATVVVPAIGAGILGWYLRRGLKRPVAILPALASPAGVLAIFLAGTTLGLVWFGFNLWIYDRYFWVLVPPLAALLMFRPELPEGAMAPTPAAAALPARRSSAPLAGVAGLLVVVLGAMSLVFLLNSAAFDAARWRAGQEMVDLGIPADAIDAGYEWVGQHATTAEDGYGANRMNWWQGLWSQFHLCGLVASTPQNVPNARLVRIDLHAYKLLLFAGDDAPLYFYRVADAGCP